MAVKPFLNEDFLLQTDVAKRLYHDFAAQMPIIDYHCHLPADEIAADKVFENITQISLKGDHYKWRAMRTNGVDEQFITGSASDFDKFQKWAETVPYTMRNPLYHWTHMELKNPFGIDKLLSEHTGKEIYEAATAKVNSSEFSVKNLLRKFQVKVVCTTDDPIDSLEHHKAIATSGYEIKVLPTFRPDKAMLVKDATSFNDYVNKLEKAANIPISNLAHYIEALEKRHQFFHDMGCRLSDHGLENIAFSRASDKQVSLIFSNFRYGSEISEEEHLQFQTFMLLFFARLDAEKGWTQQFHLGAVRNNNDRMALKLGADSGFDSIGDFRQATNMARLFNELDKSNQLAKTIIYNLNPADNEIFATMIGNYNDGSLAGKMQYGSAWWFLDQKEGMEKQMNALSNMGLLSRFVGMLTDSRSFLSYSRHEYFRRILCNLIGNDIQHGELPNDIEWLGKMVQNICYHNAANYFKF